MSSLDQRDYYRQMFFNAWQKFQAQQQLDPQEKQIVQVIQQHPEYVNNIENSDTLLDRHYRSDNNPFLHMALHLGLQEQISTNRPAGIQKIYQQLCQQTDNVHAAQHRMMDILANQLWEAQQQNALPDAQHYLEMLERLI